MDDTISIAVKVSPGYCIRCDIWNVPCNQKGAFCAQAYKRYFAAERSHTEACCIAKTVRSIPNEVQAEGLQEHTLFSCTRLFINIIITSLTVKVHRILAWHWLTQKLISDIRHYLGDVTILWRYSDFSMTFCTQHCLDIDMLCGH